VVVVVPAPDEPVIAIIGCLTDIGLLVGNYSD
jgi:xanthosine utilization system XapX-like protein